jgi:hypothetical protein
MGQLASVKEMGRLAGRTGVASGYDEAEGGLGWPETAN